MKNEMTKNRKRSYEVRKIKTKNKKLESSSAKIPPKLVKFKKESIKILKEDEYNKAINIFRKWILRDLLEECKNQSDIRQVYQDFKKGKYDDQINQEIDLLEEILWDKLKTRGYWPL